MFPFLKDVEKLAQSAHDCLDSGKVRQAKKFMRKLDRLPYGEAWTEHRILESRILCMEGKQKEAKDLALWGLNDSWGHPGLLEVIRLTNDEVGENTQEYEITIRAGGPANGVSAMFDERYVVTFIVLADDEFEAMRYLSAVSCFVDEYSPLVANMCIRRIEVEGQFRKGVYAISPFRRAE